MALVVVMHSVRVSVQRIRVSVHRVRISASSLGLRLGFSQTQSKSAASYIRFRLTRSIRDNSVNPGQTRSTHPTRSNRVNSVDSVNTVKPSTYSTKRHEDLVKDLRCEFCNNVLYV
ncbi:hypothetical protein HanRHA438_Chr02g0064571 [Helianthus annuus]|nr:hypothetical protein HanRHA438_Chr02g0064571 [Helianthus annuus]